MADTRKRAENLAINFGDEYAGMLAAVIKSLSRTYTQNFIFPAIKENASISKNFLDFYGRFEQTPQYQRLLRATKRLFFKLDEKTHKEILRFLVVRYFRKSGKETFLPKIPYRVTPIVQKAVEQNAALVSSFARDHLKNLHDVVTKALRAGASYRMIQKVVSEETKKGESYARFVARDQIAKIHADVSRQKQRQAGVPGYVWIAKKDHKTRPTHAAVHGMFFKWDEEKRNDPRPRDKNGKILDPGKDYQCRCIALPAFDEADAALFT